MSPSYPQISNTPPPLLLLLCPLSSCPLLSPFDQETSSCLPARLAAAGNSAVRVALAAQKGKERESRAGEERQRASAQEEQSQEDEVNKLTPNFQGGAEDQQESDIPGMHE